MACNGHAALAVTYSEQTTHNVMGLHVSIPKQWQLHQCRSMASPTSRKTCCCTHAGTVQVAADIL